MNNSVYIAGPVTGVEGYEKNFREAEEKLRLAGRPAEIPDQEPEAIKWHWPEKGENHENSNPMFHLWHCSNYHL